CSSKSGSPGSGQSSDDAGAPLPPGVSTQTYTMASTVPAAAETHKCQFVLAPAGKQFVVGASHKYTPGSHHLLLFRTDLKTIPAGLDKAGDCYESAAGGYMSHVRGIVYGSQVPEGKLDYPPAVGLPLESQSVLLMQTHYLKRERQGSRRARGHRPHV